MNHAGYDVFISHKSEYKPWVIWLAEALKASGRSVFLDIWNLIPGENWLDGLHRGVQKCRSAVLVATPEVVNSGWVRDEYNALKRRRESEPDFKLIPLVFGDLPDLPFLGNIQSVDFRDPAHYRNSLHKLLCGLEGREPGALASLDFDIAPPPAMKQARAAAITPGEHQFTDRIMTRLRPAGVQPMMITSRGQRHQGAVIARLLKSARGEYGEDRVIQLSPPFAGQLDGTVFFNDLGRQCQLGAETPTSVAFIAALESRLRSSAPLFLLVTGFENANAQHRAELAATLRSLSENQPYKLRIALVGGRRLVEQRHATGYLSFLSNATLDEWPDPTPADILAWQQASTPDATIDDDQIARLLQFSGGHSGLVRYCLERYASGSDIPAWQAWCYACPEIWETWSHLAGDDPDALRASLERERFGPAQPWPHNATARRLYWADLLKAQDGQLVWRTENLRQIGREVLE